jgi:hypothetical protein
MVGVDHHAIDAGGSEPSQDVRQHWAVAHGNERLGAALREGEKSRPAPGSEDHGSRHAPMIPAPANLVDGAAP